MQNQRWLDLGIMLAYLAAMVAVGVRFSRKQTSTEQYFVAKRSIPSWAMGMSLVATLITSVTFIAYPGSSYGKNWSLLIPGFMVVGVLVLVGKVIIPFYRHGVGLSAYEYFGKRFGRPTRLYASFAFTLAHFSKMGFIWYLQKYTADQTVVQRYLLAKSDRAALRGVALGASLCVPVWALFMLIGTCVWSFFKLTGEKLPAYITKPDQVFPYFLTMHL